MSLAAYLMQHSNIEATDACLCTSILGATLVAARIVSAGYVIEKVICILTTTA
jgi:hypothetical protein